MIIRIKNNPLICTSQNKKYILLRKIAIKYIKLYKLHDSSIILDNYFRKQYKKPLKTICINLINNMVINRANKNELLISFCLPNANRLAEFITYGNLEYHGCDILIKTFKNCQSFGRIL